jgi:hypothetical protein
MSGEARLRCSAHALRAVSVIATALAPAALCAQDAVLVPAAEALPAELHETHALAAGDVDGDGDVDLVLGNVGQTALWMNDGRGRFTATGAGAVPRMIGETNALALADFDGDGDLDLFLGNGGWFGGLNYFWRNDGAGRFTDASDRIPNDYTWTNGVAAGDVDGDGDLDLLLAKFNRSSLLRNDGKAAFRDATDELLPDVEAPTAAVALGDLDGDGDLDAVLGNTLYESNLVLWNDGKGRFALDGDRVLPADQSDTLALGLGDVDGDGDLDIVAGNGRLGGEQSRLYRNDGRGAFTDATEACLPAQPCETHAVLLADLDADGDLDLLLGNADGPGGAPGLVWWNDGQGRFRAAPGPGALGCERTTSLLCVDVDGDGKRELLVGTGREGGAQTVMLRRV